MEQLLNDNTLTNRICRGLLQVKMIKEGKLPRKSIDEILENINKVRENDGK
ncbi:MAG: hypothetical protein K2M93_05100 [Muribaculaceae bacterium]|nr:hypothetical protein [Muribaculaceae bacterium]